VLNVEKRDINLERMAINFNLGFFSGKQVYGGKSND
jgi:hypothetical protein